MGLGRFNPPREGSRQERKIRKRLSDIVDDVNEAIAGENSNYEGKTTAQIKVDIAAILAGQQLTPELIQTLWPQHYSDFDFSQLYGYGPRSRRVGGRKIVEWGYGGEGAANYDDINLTKNDRKFLNQLGLTNPNGLTVSDMGLRYANKLSEGKRTLSQLMAEYEPRDGGVRYLSLIPDGELGLTYDYEAAAQAQDAIETDQAVEDSTLTNNTNPNIDMSTFDYTDEQQRQNLINNIYQSTLGRDAVFGPAEGDADYWSTQIGGGTYGSTPDDITGNLQKHLMGSSEFQNRANIVNQYREQNAGANPSEAYLDSRVGPGGVLYQTEANPTTNIADQRLNNEWLQHFGNSIPSTDPLRSAVDTSNTIASSANQPGGVLQTSNPAYNQAAIDAPNQHWAMQKYGAFDTEDAYLASLNDEGSGGSDGGWNDMQRFMMMMMMMNNMGGRGGGGGGYHGSNYGYGGLNPGGVMASQSPWWTDQSAVDSFKSIWS